MNPIIDRILNKAMIEKAMGREMAGEDILSEFEKSFGSAPIGEIRTWNGVEYIKTPKGWRRKPKGFREGKSVEVSGIKVHAKNEYENAVRAHVRYGDESFAVEMVTPKKYDKDKGGFTIDRGSLKYLNAGVKEDATRDRAIINKLASTTYGDYETMKEEIDKKEGKKKKRVTMEDLPHDGLKVMDALQTSRSEYDDPSRVTVESSPKGNWILYYDGKDTGTIIGGDVLRESTVKELGWEHHDKTPSSVKIEQKTFHVKDGKIRASMYDKQSRISKLMKFAKENSLEIEWEESK